MDEIGTGVGSIVVDDKNGLRLVIDHQVSTKLKNRCCGVVDPATGAIWTKSPHGDDQEDHRFAGVGERSAGADSAPKMAVSARPATRLATAPRATATGLTIVLPVACPGRGVIVAPLPVTPVLRVKAESIPDLIVSRYPEGWSL
jgi:hypothetical protein